MYELSSEQDPQIDWGKTPTDYAKHRPGPPPSFYHRLKALNVGLSSQRIMDLGTGTGVIARQLAKQGCHVMASDISAEQIRMAAALAKSDKVRVDFQVASAEATHAPDHSLDVVTANQCCLYFDPEQLVNNLRRWLKPDGVLVISHFSWLPAPGSVAAASEKLILQHNPNWQGANYTGLTRPRYPGLTPEMHYSGYFYYDEAIPFTREAWMGRIRASRGVGATLNADQVAAFDAEHEQLLREIAEPEFGITHRIDAHLLRVGPVTTR